VTSSRPTTSHSSSARYICAGSRVLASVQVIGSDMRAPMPPMAASLGYMFQGVNQRSLERSTMDQPLDGSVGASEILDLQQRDGCCSLWAIRAEKVCNYCFAFFCGNLPSHSIFQLFPLSPQANV
jgi:hypothetical protein